MKTALLSIFSFFSLIAFSQERIVNNPNPAVEKNEVYEEGSLESKMTSIFYEVEGIEDVYRVEPTFPKNNYTGSYKADHEIFYNKVYSWIEHNKEEYSKLHSILLSEKSEK